MRENTKQEFKNGLKNGLPIGLGYLSVSFAFGVQAVSGGIPVFLTLLISMTNLTSAGQHEGLIIILSLGTIAQMIFAQLVINSRYFLMSLTLSQKLDSNFKLIQRMFCSAFITDEIFAVASVRKSITPAYFLGLATLPYIGWATGTLLGAVMGDVLPFRIVSALGIALYAMYIAIIVPPSLKERGVFCSVILGAGFSCALFYLPFINLDSGSAIIISALLSAIISALLFPIKENEEEKANG